MKLSQVTLDDFSKVIVGVVGSSLMVALNYIAIFFAWRGHEVLTDFYLTIIVALLATIILLPPFWAFIFRWIGSFGPNKEMTGSMRDLERIPRTK